jgi:hypothetical protein
VLEKNKKDGFKPLVLNYYEKVNSKLTEKEISDKYILFSNKDVKNYEMIGYYFNPFSYLSFEFVLSGFALIPEGVFHYTFATLGGDKTPNYYELKTKHGLLIYQTIPKSAFFVGLEFIESFGKRIFTATKEKAFLDYIYVSTNNFKETTDFDRFFDNYRIDWDEFMLLDFKKLEEYGQLYHSKKIDLFIEYLKKGEFNFD